MMQNDDLKNILIEKPREASYFEAVGRLITGYAAAEAVVLVLARRYSGLSDDIARVLLAGSRFDDLREKLKKLVNTHGSDFAKNEVELVLQQLGVISAARHRIAHRLSSYSGEVGLTVTNEAIAKSLDKIQTEVFKVEELQAMHFDCEMIKLRLLALMRPDLEDWFRESTPELYKPWAYKPGLSSGSSK